MGTILYMVRHAEAPFSLERERERGLSDRGKKAAALVTELLADCGIAAVVSSPYARAVETVKGLADRMGIPIELEEDLRERQLAGIDYIVEDRDFIPAVEKLFAEPDFSFPGGESNAASQRRSVAALRRVMERHKGKSIAVGTHGNIMTVMMQYFNSSIGLAFWKQTSKPDIYKMEFDDTGSLIAINRLWEEAGSG
ncbi:histidine phosphatase family protein [Paenibacillus piri]|uniref:Histidine phosphatase family protein n=1 Tax=Paenibacillus piri TaxID=2547395 RepID=A0A4R5KHF8_9BACL|nr:histidine phosphatase family protein [Paenibacillus piri]TDF93797.1 histidine phosphatase family protein [Paenibacillus piri]